MTALAAHDGPAPEIAVVCSSYRRPALLPRLVAALEAQTLDPARFEVVIVDNGSGDETSEVLEHLATTSSVRLRPLRVEENTGPGPARNLGWRASTAPFVAFTDDDCVPDRRWLESGLTTIRTDERCGVVQGCTLRPPDQRPTSDWTMFREVIRPSPYFEGCNLFFRREALEATGGFAEDVGFGSEDTVAGWSVLAAGWKRDFDETAVVRHDLVDRGLRFHLVMAWREGSLVDVAARYPALRTEGFWRPWAHRRRNVAFPLAVFGVAAATRRPAAAALALPWLWERRNGMRHPRPWKIYAAWIAEDACVFAGMTKAAVRNRMFVL